MSETCQTCFGRGYYTRQALTTPSVSVPKQIYYCTCHHGDVLRKQHESMPSLKKYEVEKK